MRNEENGGKNDNAIVRSLWWQFMQSLSIMRIRLLQCSEVEIFLCIEFFLSNYLFVLWRNLFLLFHFI